MTRRTPILAIILAPLAVVLLVQVWNKALVPLYLSARYSSTVLQWRLDSEQSATRIAAIRDIASPRADGMALLDEVVARLQTDESPEVRKAAAATLGQLGWQRPLTAEAIDALSTLILNTQDDGLLSAAVVAVGRSASKNRYPDTVVERIGGIFVEKHLAWLHTNAARVLGQVGAAQPLPDTVFAIMNTLFTDPVRPGERENLANAFTEIAKGQGLPVTTLDILAHTFENEPNRRIRTAIIFAMAHCAADYPKATPLITAARSDPDQDIVRTAEHGLRIIDHRRDFTNREPLTITLDTSRPVDVRLKALQIIRGSRIDPAAYEQIATLARDPETEIATAALDLFRYLARAPDDDFDRRILIPELTQAMSNPAPVVRKAAYEALSTIAIHRPAYLHAADFPARLEVGAQDPEPAVRVVALFAMLRGASDTAQRDAILERAMTDPAPYVRGMTVGWLASPRVRTGLRQKFLAKALKDPDPDVRRSATVAQQDWETRKRAWPIELWQKWQAGERRRVGMTILIFVTVATPVLIGAIFLIYYMARLLTYLHLRRWRAVAAIPVMATWAAASYGMFMLYFVAGMAGDVDAGETAILIAVLWGAIVLYAALGWGLHYAVHR
jgi:HEAT repeat protein